jgi:hypothetical protein
MFRARTLFVLGAGASAEVGMPIGSKLLEDVVKLTNIAYYHGRMSRGDAHLSEALKIALNEGGSVDRYNEHLHAAWQLAASAEQALSIDNVIDALEDEKVERVGKLGIVRAIHMAESQSDHFKDANGRFDGIVVGKFKRTWFDYLTKLLTEGVRKSGIGHIFDNLEIINFNYDRCIEQYLPFSLASYYGLNVETVRALMPRLIVHRPYGVAGKLPWQGGDVPTVEFGGGSTQRTAEAATQIRTFTEQVEEGEALELMRASLSNAERIIFLGFAFHRQNVELIAAKTPDNAEIVATAFEVSKSDREVIEVELIIAFEFDGIASHERVKLADLPCAKFFQEYWRTLTADGPPMRYPEEVC